VSGKDFYIYTYMKIVKDRSDFTLMTLRDGQEKYASTPLKISSARCKRHVSEYDATGARLESFLFTGRILGRNPDKSHKSFLLAIHSHL
jgi:hypothetical protein